MALGDAKKLAVKLTAQRAELRGGDRFVLEAAAQFAEHLQELRVAHAPAQHVHDPGALLVGDDLPGGGIFGRLEAEARGDGEGRVILRVSARSARVDVGLAGPVAGIRHATQLYSYLLRPTTSKHELADVVVRQLNVTLSGAPGERATSRPPRSPASGPTSSTSTSAPARDPS